MLKISLCFLFFLIISCIIFARSEYIVEERFDSNKIGKSPQEVKKMISAKNNITPAKGPLKVHPSNPRYFTDGTGKAIYLVGSHTWSNFKDMGKTEPPPSFDFEGYLDFLKKYNHNFIRLWTWELSTYTYDGEIIYAQPFPWKRTGQKKALDGKPKFDLKQFNQAYFDRLRSRVVSAGEQGIYVSIMLFEGHGLHASLKPWCWNGHPFNVNNNINGIDGDQDGDGRGLETHTLKIPEITSLQEAYVRKVIDTVNDLDNVLYEIANESGSYSTEWQYHIIDYIHQYEKDKPKQHPVGMTFQFARDEEHKGTNSTLFDSPAEWISPNPKGGYRDNPPASDGSKVILSDTDHLWGIGGNQAWVWKSFCRGLNPIFMDAYRQVEKGKQQQKQQTTWTDHLSDSVTLEPKWQPIRKSMGYTLSYANKMNLVVTAPKSELASTKYCLANPGNEYLIYLPDGGSVKVDLSDTSGELVLEWFNPDTGKKNTEEVNSAESSQQFTAPFSGDAVLYIVDKDFLNR